MNKSNGGQTKNSFLAGFGAVWELDLWGRVRRMNEAARANFMATQEGRRAVMISLVSGVAAAYFELLELDDQLAIAQRTRDSYERMLKLFSDQHTGGLASKLEVSRAELALRTVTATIPEIERQISLKENEINTILGRNPGPIARTSTLLAQELPANQSRLGRGQVALPTNRPHSLPRICTEDGARTRFQQDDKQIGERTLRQLVSPQLFSPPLFLRSLTNSASPCDLPPGV